MKDTVYNLTRIQRTYCNPIPDHHFLTSETQTPHTPSDTHTAHPEGLLNEDQRCKQKEKWKVDQKEIR